MGNASEVLPRWSSSHRSLTPTPRAQAITWRSASPSAAAQAGSPVASYTASASTAFRTLTPRDTPRQLQARELPVLQRPPTRVSPAAGSTSRSISPSPAIAVASTEARASSPQRRAAGAFTTVSTMTGHPCSWVPMAAPNTALRHVPSNISAVAAAWSTATVGRSSTPTPQNRLVAREAAAFPLAPVHMAATPGDIGARGRALSPASASSVCPVFPPPRMSGGLIVAGQRPQGYPSEPQQQLSGIPQPQSLSATPTSTANGLRGNTVQSAPSSSQASQSPPGLAAAAAAIAAALTAAGADDADPSSVPTFGRQAKSEQIPPWSPADTDAAIDSFLGDSTEVPVQVPGNVAVNAAAVCIPTDTSAAWPDISAPTRIENGCGSGMAAPMQILP